jgi:hypothetical protein
MEPSLKNSHSRGYDLKLRRTDQALHDTTQRFVESLSKDVRISQFTDTNLASKLLINDKWYWLQPVIGGRAGYLVCLPDQPIVWMDEQFKQSFRIPMRVSSAIYEKKSVFLASLNKVDGFLRLEDAWMVGGEFLRGRPFTSRWEALCSFYDSKYRMDTVLQQGFRIDICSYEALINITKWTSIPSVVFAQGERHQRRLRIQLVEQKPKSKMEYSSSSLSSAPAFVEPKEVTTDYTTTADDVAKAVPHEEYPDTYDLWMKGVKKGYAAVQDLALSRHLRQATSVGKEKKEVLVKVAWNSEFDMFEIVSLV